MFYEVKSGHVIIEQHVLIRVVHNQLGGGAGRKGRGDHNGTYTYETCLATSS